ncbi:FG-GAP-like repeat-containing protein, partial [bacterium]
MKRYVVTALLAIVVIAVAVPCPAVEGWRIISVPCHTGPAGVTGVFEEAPLYVFGVGDDGGYEPLDGALVPGKSYWMYFTDNPRPSGGCMTVSYSTTELSIHPGWNLVGSPYIGDTGLPGELGEAYEYSPETGEYMKATTLSPWTGYFIKAPESCASGCSITIANPDYTAAGRADEPRIPRAVACPVSGDTTGNSIVEPNDLFPITTYYGTVVTDSSSSEVRRADSDGNGIVDASDIFAVSRNMGDSCTGGITNTPPLATAQSVETSQDLAVSITLSGTDDEGASLTYSIVSNPANGTLDISSLPTVSYTPSSGFFGVDSFTFKVSDGELDSKSAAVTVTVAESDTPSVAAVTNVEVVPDPVRRHSSLIVSWDPPTDETINAYDIYCNGVRINACPERLQCFDGMGCDPDIVYTYFINIPNLPTPPADPTSYMCSAQIQAFVVDSSNLIAKQSQLSAAVAASTFAHTADSPYAGGTTTQEGTAEDCSGMRSGGRSANAGAGTVPLANAQIEAWRKESSSESPNGTLVATVYANAQGYYEFSSLDPGYYNFIAFHDNETTQTDDDIYSILESINIQPEPFNAGGFNNLGEMKLEETGSMYGVVRLALDSTGDSLLDTPDDAYLGIDVYIPGTSFTAKTNKSGEFYILYLPPGTYSIVAVADNYAIVQVDSITIESKQITTVTPNIVLLASIGSVVGVATFADSANNGDASVTLVNDADPMTTYNTSTLTDGSFTFSGVATGTYTLNVIRYGWDPYEHTNVSVLSNTTTDLGTIGPVSRIPAPDMTSIAPTSGDNDAATTITITGTAFATGTLFYIKKGLTEAELQNITYVSDTEMTADVPSGYDWGIYDIMALNPDAQTDTLSEVYSVTLPAPTVTAISPVEMDNSVALESTITGSGLVDGVVVRIGTTQTSNTIVAPAGTSLTTVVPAGITAGVYDITATNPDSAGRAATLAGAFTVRALTTITPDPSSGGVLSIMAGDTEQFSATCSFTDGATTTQQVCTNDVLWYSSTQNAGTITLTGGLFSAVAAGTTYITAQRGTVSSTPVQVAVYNSDSIFMNTGQQIYGAKDHRSMTVSGDFDGDGDIDIVSTNNGLTSPYTNDGEGTINLMEVYGCGVTAGTSSLGAADFDGDGDIDVVCTWGPSFGTGIMPNDLGNDQWIGGSGSSAEGIETTSVAIADFNMDGRPDWAVGNPGGANEVYFANSAESAGQITSTSSGETLGSANTMWLAAGDVDGDGNSDLVSGNKDAGNRVWLNDGDGTFTDSGQSFGSNNTTFLILADFDADGDLDLYEGTGGLDTDTEESDAVWLNGGSGTFTDSGQSFPNTNTWSSVATDMDNDGDTDLIIGVARGAYNLFYLNDGSAAFTDSTQQLSPTTTNSVAVGDFNGDYKIDYIDSTLSGILVYTGGHGGIPENTRPSPPTILTDSVTDNESDQQFNDVTLTWNEGSDSETTAALLTYNLNLYRSDGFTISSTIYPVGPGLIGNTNSVSLRNLPIGYYYWRIQAVDTGFLTSAWSVSGTFITGMTFTESGTKLDANDTGGMLAADLDGDGDADLVEGRTTAGGGTNVVWANGGSGDFTELGTFGSADTTCLRAADIDSDGDTDIIECANGQNYVWLNNGIGFFTDGADDIGSGNTTDIVPVDLDNDGDYDIFSAESGSASTVYRNDGGSFSTFYSVDTYTTGGADAMDVSGDGAADVILSVRDDGMVLYYNDMSGFLYEVDTYDNPDISDVIIRDVTGDDNLDFIMVDEDYIRVLNGRGYGYTPSMFLSNTAYGVTSSAMTTAKLLIADLDVDGEPDLVALNYKQPSLIMLFEEVEDSFFFPVYTEMNQSEMPAVAVADGAVADLDGDMDLDIAIGVADGTSGTYDTFLLNSHVIDNSTPMRPGGLSADTTGGNVVLSWNHGNDDETPQSVLMYDVMVQNLDTGNWLMNTPVSPSAGMIPAATRTVVLQNIQSQNYTWFVRTVDSGMKASDWSTGATFRPTEDSTDPTFAGIQLSSYSQVTMTLDISWNAATDDSRPILYNIYESTATGGQDFNTPTYTTYETSKSVSGLTDYQNYCYVVRAQDSANPPNEDSNIVELCTATNPEYDAPVFGGITGAATGVEIGSVDLTWNAATDDNPPVTYNIYYSKTSGGQSFATPNETSTSGTGATISGLDLGETYYFVVRAQDATAAQNESANLEELSAAARPVPDVLLVDGDRSSVDRTYENYFIDSLDNLGLTYYHFDKYDSDTSTYVKVDSTLVNYFLDPEKIIIWFSGENSTSYKIMATDEDDIIIDYLESGGNLFVTGMKFVYSISTYDIYKDGYFGVTDYDYGTSDTTIEVAAELDPVAYGLDLQVPYSSGDGAQNQNYSYSTDISESEIDGDICYRHEDNDPACVKYYNPTTGAKTVLFFFGFEGIDTQAARDGVMQRVYNWLTNQPESVEPVFGGVQSVSSPDEVGGTMTLEWNAATDDSEPILYNVYQAVVSGGQSFIMPDYSTYGVSLEITGLINGQ